MERRTLIKSALGAALATTGAMQATGAASKVLARSRTFVLIHGAWHGGWCWRDVAALLRAQGHRVYTPSLTGLADRSHLLSSSLTLQTHIDDIVNLFKWEDIDDAVLVAHSYGGWPVSGAVETIGDKVNSIVFLDAFLPDNGQRVIDLNAPQFQQALKEAIARGEAGRPVPPVKGFGIKDLAKAAWVQSKMTPQPTGVAMQPIVLSGARERIAKKTYVRAVGYAMPTFDRYLAHAQQDPSWKAIPLAPSECGHDVMVDIPDKLSKILLSVA
ncbi:alpha/beta hydrolase family protein [Sphingomonas sp. LB3N6]|uniref:alpha/beta fold hydrolase n=1 Tax=Sphingomonas fucosidasi TaxID=3096164 RepID=UPI002FC9C80B